MTAEAVAAGTHVDACGIWRVVAESSQHAREEKTARDGHEKGSRDEAGSLARDAGSESHL